MQESDETYINDLAAYLSECRICPRKCGVNRLAGECGYCGQTAEIVAARAALHYWEEPCISGTNGSGAVFFSGCNLRCVYCQNREIALSKRGQTVSVPHLAEIFLSLQQQKAHNINLVTATHYIPQVHSALLLAKQQGLTIPVVYNTGSYEEVDSLRMLDGLIDIYLPDLKYLSAETGARFSNAPDYFEKAFAALKEMLRQVGRPVFDKQTGLMKRGMIVRHLLLPGMTGESKRILRRLHETFGNDIYISIMNQYTPMPQLKNMPAMADIDRKVTDDEYRRLLDFADMIGIELGFCQEGDTAKESFIPPFNGEGLIDNPR